MQAIARADFRKIAREEVDNIHQLIELCESTDGKVLEHAEDPEEESVFMLGPDPEPAAVQRQGLVDDDPEYGPTDLEDPLA